MKRFDVVGHYDADVDILYGDDGDYVLYEEAQAEIENARRSSEYWKAEHAAANAEIEELQEVLRTIGNFAHDRSTGPTVEDALWEVRRMAYEPLTKGSES